jgi:hypothetical protein
LNLLVVKAKYLLVKANGGAVKYLLAGPYKTTVFTKE